MFLAGNLLQFVSHWQLAALSRGSKAGSEETAYKIPTGAEVDARLMERCSLTYSLTC